MKIRISKTHVILFFLAAICLFTVFDADAQPNLGTIDSQVKSATDSVKKWANWIIGASVLVGSIFAVFALMNGNPQAKNYVIGTVAGLVLWAIVNSVL